MKLYHVEKCESWKTAPKSARSEFIEAMRNCSYGAGETLEAWEWYIIGWLACEASHGSPFGPPQAFDQR
jgi:hypothetical protein